MKKPKETKPGYGRILDAWAPAENSGEPIGCIATSFTFSPALFEEECLGRFVALETSAAEDGPAYLIEREEKLSQLSCAAALVDQHHACGVRSLRWDLLAARVPRGILHAKIAILLWSRRARLIVGSANITDDGYRRNQEVFGVLDYFEGSLAALSVLVEISDFLRDAVRYAASEHATASPGVKRWLEFIDRVSKTTRDWGATDTPRGFSKPRVMAVCSGPGRSNVFDSLRSQWPDTSRPGRAYVISPFFDPPAAENTPALQIWNLLAQRGDTSVEYQVTTEEITGEQAILVHAPQSLLVSPRGLQSTVSVSQLCLDDGRPLHAKCIWLENKRIALHLIGSSNFTSAGLGLGRIQNLEANLAFCVGTDAGESYKALERAWPIVEEIPEELELRWQPLDDGGEDSPSDEANMLPLAFANASFGCDSGGHYVLLEFAGAPPADWALFAEESDLPSATEAAWHDAGEPLSLRLVWNDRRAPSGFRVNWEGSNGFAWWPVNALNSAALPPPDELKNLPLDVLIAILNSAKPLHLALADWLRRRSDDGAAGSAIVDPHKRVDTSAFLLQRTRRVSAGLSGLRQRLERPVYSTESLLWRIRGPVGVTAMANAIVKEARSGAEQCFLLTELCLDLARVKPQVAPGSLSRERVTAVIKAAVQEIKSQISLDAAGIDPSMAAYARSAFEELWA